jgi:hypothetical protein
MMHHKHIPTFTGDAWLANLLEHAAASNACVSWGCTTCGAQPFRNALVHSAQSTGRSDSLYEIAGQLGKVAVRPEYVEAIRFVIMFINAKASPIAFNQRLLPLFIGSPAEGVYRAMLAHHEKVTARRRSHELRSDPNEIKRHKQQRADEKRVRLAERAQRKGEIDKAWRARTNNKKPVER